MDAITSAAPPRSRARPRPPFECIARTLQGGGALGAYQAGVYQALDEAGIRPDWVAGISIGAINAALIAGNPRERRVARLREFWQMVSTNPVWGAAAEYAAGFAADPNARRAVNQVSALTAVVAGAPGFFAPRPLPPTLAAPGSPAATSWYDTAPFKHTLE
ncbi:MAG: patatin-like phospholipase family protein, partial [Stellaceae bacterium]